jgi:imidazolonepropionase-like amidohydrolase
MADKQILTADSIWMQGSSPQKDIALLADNGRASEVNPVHLPRGQYKQVRKPGLILPGFVDCHVHMGLRNSAESIGPALTAGRRAGITALRDAGDRDGQTLSAKKDGWPILVPAGKAISFHGRYGGFLGHGISSIPEGLNFIGELAEQGAGVIKLILTGSMAFNKSARVSGPFIYREDIRRLTRAAHARGLKVMAHVNSDQAIREAVHGGVDSIEHGYFITDSTLEILASQGIAWIPTLSPLYYIGGKEKDAATKIMIKGVLQGQLASLKKAVGMNVLIGVGTDYVPGGEPWPDNFRRELQLYHMAGLGWQEVIKAASFNGYKVLGLESLLRSPTDINLLINLSGCMKDLSTAAISLVADILTD